MSIPLGTVADRIWYAWQCLPRGPDGEPPSFRSLERDHGIPEATISKFVRGIQRSSGGAVSLRLSRAFQVSPEWLFEEGNGAVRPTLTGVYRPRDGASLKGEVDAFLRGKGFAPNRVTLAMLALFSEDV